MSSSRELFVIIINKNNQQFFQVTLCRLVSNIPKVLLTTILHVQNCSTYLSNHRFSIEGNFVPWGTFGNETFQVVVTGEGGVLPAYSE